MHTDHGGPCCIESAQSGVRFDVFPCREIKFPNALCALKELYVSAIMLTVSDLHLVLVRFQCLCLERGAERLIRRYVCFGKWRVYQQASQELRLAFFLRECAGSYPSMRKIWHDTLVHSWCIVCIVGAYVGTTS